MPANKKTIAGMARSYTLSTNNPANKKIIAGMARSYGVSSIIPPTHESVKLMASLRCLPG